MDKQQKILVDVQLLKNAINSFLTVRRNLANIGALLTDHENFRKEFLRTCDSTDTDIISMIICFKD